MRPQPGDRDRTKLAQSLHSAIAQTLAADPDVVIDVLPEAQLYISKHLVAAPDGGKAARHVPAPDGYTIHVRIADGDDDDRLRQRRAEPGDAVVLDAATTPLRLDRSGLDQSWQLRGGAGSRIALTVRCGSASVFDEVDRVLDTLGRIVATDRGTAGS